MNEKSKKVRVIIKDDNFFRNIDKMSCKERITAAREFLNTWRDS